jgi:hypothetical protein
MLRRNSSLSAEFKSMLYVTMLHAYFPAFVAYPDHAWNNLDVVDSVTTRGAMIFSVCTGRGFYVRAERASLPQHAPDKLAVRIQAIDGERTSTLLDSQHCRRLLSWRTDFHPRAVERARHTEKEGRRGAGPGLFF